MTTNARSAREPPGKRRPPHSRTNEEKSDRCILVQGLNPKTPPGTVRDFFSRYGEIELVDINVDDNEVPDGSAIVLFRRIPYTYAFINERLSIDNRPVRVSFAPEKESDDRSFKNSRQFHKSRFPAKYFSMGVMAHPKTFVECWTTHEQVALIVNYDLRNIQIHFSHLNENYRLEFNFKNLNGDIKMEREHQAFYFTIPLKYPARFWRQNKKAVKETKTSIRIGGQWERVIDIPIAANSLSLKDTTLRRTAVMLVRPKDKLEIGYWTVYRVRFHPPQGMQGQIARMLEEAATYNLVPRELHLQRPTLTVVKASSIDPPIGHVQRASLITSFDVLYTLESMITNYYLDEYNLDHSFYDKLEQLRRLNPAIACGLLELMAMEKKRVWDPTSALLDVWDRVGMKVQNQKSLPPHCASMRKILVTPSSIYVQPPTVETTNRVVRAFQEHADRFIRVQFVDEGLSRISASHTGTSNEAIYNRIYTVLKDGIQIGARRYDFLAFSSSQLRDHGCWFFAPTKDLNANRIREWMGTFSHVKIIAKHAVRMGQCFSSTRPITRLQENEIEEIAEVEKNGFTFSDGVGKISLELAREVALKMELKTVPSAFQFRLGGAKGVLAIAKDLNGRKVQLRPSQIKFRSNHHMLEVIRYSTLIPAYLNRQAITLLSALGVKDEIFMKLMEDMISGLNRMLENPNEAVRVLLSNLDEFGTTRMMARIIGAGFLEKKDPHILNLLNVFRVSVLKDLKKKAKINVPKGAFLLGVMDETRSLKEGEVFCQISQASETAGKMTVIEGECVVFRNPCFHPGDVRVVKAVDCPKLRHLSDVLVFSAEGYRDVPSMCSGGDLDGDDYTIFWDKNLMPKIKNYPPMDYKAEEPQQVDDVQIGHILKFFVNYINNDNLGQIANAHLATADRSAKGAFDGACLRLAQLHSLAVDFPKSGKRAVLDEDLRVRIFPDFMQKKDKEMYVSNKVLGRIYRAVHKDEYKDYRDQLQDDAIYDARLRVPNMERYIVDARDNRARYNRDLMSLMNQYGVQTEAEIVSGFIIKWLKKGNRKSTHEVQKQTMAAVNNLMKFWRRQFEREFLSEGEKREISSETRAELEAKAAAWYYVTYHAEERRRDLSVEGQFLSFPWVVYDIICDVAKKNNHRVPTEDQTQPIDDNLADALWQQRAGKALIVAVSDSEDESEEEEEEEDEDNEDEEDTQVESITLNDLRRGNERRRTPASAAAKASDASTLFDSSSPSIQLSSRYSRPDEPRLVTNTTDEGLLDALLG
ncbi:hypothetical protein EC973_003435 [Apophysomyces ossiformis]|uniref:RNA-dependent RNA polymerase n=1 Tax=Apophysomyces ossiformis TaxID=679940 RepID=A0A8H7BFT5_9FUNG|nr:hypothetical protein EC973_003435 [Apophysomyces ossiformis]